MKTIISTLGDKILVDDEDYSLLSRWRWSMAKGYAYTKISRYTIYMHRLIFGPPGRMNFEIDHINGNRLDNQKSNLRYCSHTNNLRNSRKYKSNSSGYKGVRLDKKRNKWLAEICGIYLGRFNNKQDAICCRINAATQLFGEYIYHGTV